MPPHKLTEDETEDWLDAKGVAALRGITLQAFYHMRSKGLAPPPDLVWMNRNLWKPATIHTWISEKRKARHNRTTITGVPRKRAKGTKPPKVIRNAGTSSGASRTRRRLANRKVIVPENARISLSKAQRIAADLRAAGLYCTTEDVLALHVIDEPLEDLEREELRLKVRMRA